MQKIATVISKIGWDKKLSDLKEETLSYDKQWLSGSVFDTWKNEKN